MPTAQKGIHVIRWVDMVTHGRLGSTTHCTLAAERCIVVRHAHFQLNRASVLYSHQMRSDYHCSSVMYVSSGVDIV